MLQRLDAPVSSLRPMTSSFSQEWLFGWSFSGKDESIARRIPRAAAMVSLKDYHAQQCQDGESSGSSSSSSSSSSGRSGSSFTSVTTSMSRGTSMATNSKFFLLSDDDDDDDDDDDGEAKDDDDDGDDAHPLQGQTCVDSHMMLYAVDEGDDDTLHDADESLHGDDCTVFDDEFDEFGDQDHDDDVIDLFSKRTDQLHAERRPSLLSTMLRVASLSSSSSLSSISPPPSTSNSQWSPADAPPCFQRAMSPPVHPLAPIQAELDLSSSLRQCVDWEQQQNRRWGPLGTSVHHPIPLAGSMDPTMAW